MAEQSTADEMRERFKKRIPAEAWEHAKAAQEEMRKSWEAMFPPGFVEHRRAARREALLAVRSLLDHALKEMDKKVAE